MDLRMRLVAIILALIGCALLPFLGNVHASENDNIDGCAKWIRSIEVNVNGRNISIAPDGDVMGFAQNSIFVRTIEYGGRTEGGQVRSVCLEELLGRSNSVRAASGAY